MLGHLSEQNNTPQVALTTSVSLLEEQGMKFRSDYSLDIAPSEAGIKTVIF